MFQRALITILSGVGMAAISSPALGQDTAVPDEATLDGATAVAPPASAKSKPVSEDQEEIVVTALKRQTRALDVPQSISVVTGQKLESDHAQSLTDFLTKIPSANVVTDQAGQARIVLRGINAGGVGATVATYIDESPFGSATSLANGAVLAPDLDPYDLARVEVLRGPQGTLYGANSLGGLVKYVTVSPDPSRVAASAEVGVMSVAHGDNAPWLRGLVNLPMGANSAVRVSGYWRENPGFIDDPNLGKDVNDGNTYGGRVAFLTRPSERLTLRASALIQNIRSNGTSTVDVDPLTLKPVIGKYEHFRTIEEPNDVDYRLYNATVDYDFGPFNFVSATSFGRLVQTGKVDATGLYGPLLSFIFDTPLGVGVDQTQRQRRFTEEARISSNGLAMFQWTLGGFYTTERNRLLQNLYGVDYDTAVPVPSFDGLILVDLPSKYREVAGFANGTVNFSSRFDLTAGARYSHNRQSVVQTTDGPLAGGLQTFDGTSSDNVFTYSVAPSFKPNDDTRIYARVAKGYRPGGPNAVSPLAPAGVPRQFGPDTTVNYEAGIKGELINRQLAFELTGFAIDWKDIQLLAQIEGFGVNANGGKARSSGVEFNLEGRPAPGVSVFANGSIVHARLTQNTPAVVGGKKGDPLPYNPRFQATVGVEYSRAMGDDAVLRAGASLQHIGKRYSNFDTILGQRKLDPYDRLDAHVGADLGRFRVDLFGHNLTGARGILNLGTVGTAQNGAVAAAVMQPRTFGIALGARY